MHVNDNCDNNDNVKLYQSACMNMHAGMCA